MSFLRERGKSFLDNAAYDAISRWLWPGVWSFVMYLATAIYGWLSKIQEVHWNWRILAGLLFVAVAINIYAVATFVRRRPTKNKKQIETIREPQADELAPTPLVSEIRKAAIEREFGPRNVPPALTEAQRHEAWEKDQAEKGISITLPRSFSPPTAAQRQQLAELRQKLVNLREKGKKVAAMPDPPAGFDYPGVMLRTLRNIDEIQEEITRLEDAQRNPNVPLRSLQPIEIRDLIDGLIADGALLVTLWEKRLDSASAAKRYEQSVKWISSAEATVKKHLTIHQFDKLTSRLASSGMSEGDRISFGLHIIHAGTRTDSIDYEVAHKVADRVEILKQLRGEITQPS